MAKKTRLTAGLRSNIKTAIMADIPIVNYQSIIQDYLNREARAQLPIELQDSRFTYYIGDTYVKEFGKYVPNPCYKPTDADHDFVRLNTNLDCEQHERLRNVRLSITALLETFNYVEDFIAASPEFAKYAPLRATPIANLPAAQLTEQLHSIGWPKSDEGK